MSNLPNPHVDYLNHHCLLGKHRFFSLSLNVCCFRWKLPFFFLAKFPCTVCRFTFSSGYTTIVARSLYRNIRGVVWIFFNEENHSNSVIYPMESPCLLVTSAWRLSIYWSWLYIPIELIYAQHFGWLHANPLLAPKSRASYWPIPSSQKDLLKLASFDNWVPLNPSIPSHVLSQIAAHGGWR